LNHNQLCDVFREFSHDGLEPLQANPATNFFDARSFRGRDPCVAKLKVTRLDHDGNIVTDSSVIIEYLDEVVPQTTNLTPRDPVKRATMRSLMRFIDEMPTAAVRVPTYNLAFLPRYAAMSDEEFVAHAESKPLRKEFLMAMGRTGFPQKEMDTSLSRLRRSYERMDESIKDSGGPWLFVQNITLADVSVMPALVRMADLGRENDWADLPRVAKWYELIQAQSAFKPTYYSGSLLTERFPHLQKKAAHG
jgi:glutathione S-transferase